MTCTENHMIALYYNAYSSTTKSLGIEFYKSDQRLQQCKGGREETGRLNP